MRKNIKLIIIIQIYLCFVGVTYCSDGQNGNQVFEVKGKSVNSIVYSHGKITKSSGGDEVIYLVDIPSKTVTRTAVLNSGIKEVPLAGLQSDNTVYSILHDEPNWISGQRHIKAFGKAGLTDGYETIVIGEDFIVTSNSKADYFVLYYYKRIDPLAETYRNQKK